LVTVRYFPDGDDALLYTPVSGGLWIEPLYHSPNISFNYPPSVFPGKEYRVSGRISVGDQLIENTTIIIEGFDSTNSIVSDRVGAFVSSIKIPDDIGVGVENIYVSFKGAGQIGPLDRYYKVQVEKLEITLDSTSPWFLLSGSDLSVSGSISSTGTPLAKCQVIVEFGNKVYFGKTDIQGNFDFSISSDVLTLSTNRPLSVTAIPNEPWIERGLVESSILVFNSLFTFPPALLLGILIYRSLIPVEPVSSPILEDAPETVLQVYPKASGLSVLYIRAVQVVNRISGIGLRPSHTIREYLAKVRPSISRRVFSLFYQISRLFERWVYNRKRGRPPLRTTEGLLKSLEDEEDSS
jgi:hypothetical protein